MIGISAVNLSIDSELLDNNGAPNMEIYWKRKQLNDFLWPFHLFSLA